MRTISRYVPENSQSITRDDIPAIVYTYTAKDGKPAAIAYIGKSGKPACHYRFFSESQRQSRIDQLFDGVRAQAEFKNARKAERESFQHSYKPGDILYSSWGYEQTNIDFYQVIATTEKTITVRQLCATKTETGFMCGDTAPIPGKFWQAETYTRKVCPNDHGGYIKISSFEHAYQWDGQTKHCSWYG